MKNTYSIRRRFILLRTKRILPFTLMILMFCASGIFAQVVDPNFNVQLQTTRYSWGFPSIIKVLPNGKMLIYGNCNNYNGVTVPSLFRLNADLTIDTSFSSNQTLPDFVGSITLQNDGKIIVRGSNKMVRLTQDGVNDAIFDSNWQYGYITEVKIDASGRVVVAGSISYVLAGSLVTRSIVRLNADWSVDTTFNFATNASEVNRIVPQGNKIVYSSFDNALQRQKTYRSNEDGSQDSKYSSTLLGPFNMHGLKCLPDNKILALTSERITRLNENGGVDSSFTDKIFPNIGNGQPLFKVNSGKIILAYTNPVAPYGIIIFRINSDGTNDSTFTPYNLYTPTGIGVEGGDEVFGIQPDGSLIFNFANQPGSSFFSRLLPSGIRDLTFNAGGNGFTFVNPGKVRAIKTYADGKVLIGGDFDKVGNIARTKIARLNIDGTLDSSFSINTSGSQGAFVTVNDVYGFVIQSDGKIIVNGNFTYLNGSQKQHLVRLNTNGTIDTAFNLSITIQDWFESTSLGQNKIIPVTSGKYLIGTTRNSQGDTTVVPVQLTSIGSNDSSFTPSFFSNLTNVTVYDVAVQTDGKLIVSGKYGEPDLVNPPGTIIRGFIKRLNTDGSVDPSFNPALITGKTLKTFSYLSSGKFLTVESAALSAQIFRLDSNGFKETTFATGVGANGDVNAILPLNDGKIVIGGNFTTYNGQPRTNLAILNADGTLNAQTLMSNGTVLCLTLDSQGRILVGGEFTAIGNGTNSAIAEQLVSRSYIARLSLSNQRLPIFDFDGDGKTDISIYRPSLGQWWYLRTSDNANRAFQFGSSTDKIVPADYTGDGKTDIAMFTSSNGFWSILRSEDSTYYAFPFGTNGDIPAPADYDGDGKADAAVFRPSAATWYISKSSGGTIIQQFGAIGDVPVVGDYDGDGKADLAICRVALGQWWFVRSSDGTNRAFTFGTSTDKPVQGDYTGDGKTDVAIYRPTTGEWFILRSEDSTFYAFPFGASGDIPTAGDYDGDGKFDAAIFRPSAATWYLNRSTAGIGIVGFGANGDLPVPNAFVP
jgi:uncharacterized delta-60 repeat protein